MPLFLRALPLVLAGLAGCTQFPELDYRAEDLDPYAPYPALVPVEPLLAQSGQSRVTDEDAPALRARVAALRARAAQLQRTTIDSDTRDRMNRGVAR
ncbi:hypothetical protein M8745_01310 [Lutimaribacter sp. EGI FJ00014]|nr:hypothetical protein [Lutimaribacter sp. EGI FJ00014]